MARPVSTTAEKWFWITFQCRATEGRRRGLDVDGVDSSADMLERLRRRADEQGIGATVFHQRMEALNLPRRYRAIFLAGPTFTLLPDDATALAALRGIRAHLPEGGTALVPLFTPAPTPAEQISRVRTAAAPDGAEHRVSVVAEQRDETARTQTTLLRYERHHGTDSTIEDRPWTMHWYTQDQFETLATTAGLTVTAVTDPDGKPVPADGTGLLHCRLQAT
ncbi:class I SAM-dependent methyltransferase [Streptomyces sp. A30]|uniref:class I SAM-dependent methyltransferase n=1 Tax=Streptomyces sp. A30 TaxID=2789273 RepID=UPI0039815906